MEMSCFPFTSRQNRLSNPAAKTNTTDVPCRSHWRPLLGRRSRTAKQAMNFGIEPNLANLENPRARTERTGSGEAPGIPLKPSGQTRQEGRGTVSPPRVLFHLPCWRPVCSPCRLTAFLMPRWLSGSRWLELEEPWRPAASSSNPGNSGHSPELRRHPERFRKHYDRDRFRGRKAD
jgi:hypothetical protein